jgi:hypothetical protein
LTPGQPTSKDESRNTGDNTDLELLLPAVVEVQPDHDGRLCERSADLCDSLGEAMASAHQIDADVLARANHVAQRLLLAAGDADRAQRVDHQKAHQSLGVPPVGLDPVLRGTLDLPRRPLAPEAATPTAASGIATALARKVIVLLRVMSLHSVREDPQSQ